MSYLNYFYDLIKIHLKLHYTVADNNILLFELNVSMYIVHFLCRLSEENFCRFYFCFVLAFFLRSHYCLSGL